MLVEVRPLNLRGRLLFKDERGKAPPCRGMLRVKEKLIRSFGRTVPVAGLFSANDGFAEEMLPTLLDARILWAEQGRMRLHGQELVDGVLYGQTWDIKVL